MSIAISQVKQLNDLNAAVKSRALALKDISDATGVHLSQVSRILAGKAKRSSQNVMRICKFAIESGVAHSHDLSEEVLRQAIEGVWDGTPAHAQRIARLLNAIRDYQLVIPQSESQQS